MVLVQVVCTRKAVSQGDIIYCQIGNSHPLEALTDCCVVARVSTRVLSLTNDLPQNEDRLSIRM